LISGIQKLTLLDYPGKCACTVFLTGCNLRCPFCHNASLVTGHAPAAMEGDEFFAFLKKRRGLLDGVCVTGGEPTLRKDLPDFLRKIKEAGYLIKLDTNGTNPHMLRQLIEDDLLDYVAMDIKSSPERYTATCGGIDVLDSVRESAALLMEGRVDYEFRTTCCKPFQDVTAMEAIGKRDYPVIMAYILLSGFILVMGNFIADILYSFADPRIKRRVDVANGK
jgi:pyruvate formate lyase activating enzyme